MSPATSVDKINPWSDPRITFRSAHLRGRTYGYLYGTPPPGTPNRGTIVLIHGFPDISMGWRYQIPLFLSLGLTVLAPDCMGYGRTDAPAHSLADYGYKRVADDVATLCQQHGLSSIILGGHDWGGAIVYRIAQYHPHLVRALFSICTPYFPPTTKYEPLERLVATRLPNFRYQCHFVSGEVEARVQSRAEIRRFLNGMYGGKSATGEQGFVAEQGVLFDALDTLAMTPLLSEAELDYYVQEYARNGIHGPLNWYRNREVNYMDEWKFFFHDGKAAENPRAGVVEQECLFVMATKDAALKPFMAARMGERIPNLTRKEIEAGHWVLWQKPAEVNEILKEWLEGKVLNKTGSSGGKSKL